MSGKATAHTQYSEHAKIQKLSIEKIVNNRRFLFKDGKLSKEELKQKIEANITPYLVTVNPAESPLQTQIDSLVSNKTVAPSVKQEKIRQKQTLLSKGTKEYNQAVTDYQRTTADMQALVNANDTFLAPEVNKHEYLYTIDTATCKHLCLAEGKKDDCLQVFTKGQRKTIELTGVQTDAVRIWRNNVEVKNLDIKDNRIDMKTAHRDGIQLIPPPQYREEIVDGHVKLTKEADQMVGTTLENATISHCNISSPQASLQGIFSSDGMCRNLKIHDVTVATKAGHAISIAGALTGCEIRNVNLHQQVGGPMPQIRLYPLRIGGNMADEGMIYIFSFKNGTGYEYGSVSASNNRLYKSGSNQPETIEITDLRRIIPRRYLKIAFCLRDFDYPTYLKQYTSWTMADFKRKMPTYFEQMRKWINHRYSEYSSKKRKSDTFNGVQITLPNVSDEQHNPKEYGVLYMMRKAKEALDRQEASWMNTKLPEMQETALRGFTMKCIALKNGKPDRMYDLGEHDNAMRKAYLHYMLKDSDFTNMVENPYGNEPAKDKEKPAVPTISPANFTSRKPSIVQNKEVIAVGDKVTFTLDANYEGARHYWIVTGNNMATQKSSNPSIAVDTTGLTPGKYRIRASVTSKKREQHNVGLYFNITAASEKIPDTTATTPTVSAADFTSRKPVIIQDKEVVSAGDKVTFTLDAHYEGARHYWIVTGNGITPQKSSKPSLVVDTVGFKVGKYRIRASVTSKNRDQHGAELYLDVVASTGKVEKTDDTQSRSNTQPASTSENTTPTAIGNNKSWGGLRGKILASPSSAQQGDKVTFSIDTSQLNPETTTFSYFWKLGTQTGNKSTFEIDTTSLTVGEHKINVTLYTKAQGETKKTAVPGGALFKVIQKAETTTQQSQTNNTPTKPIKSSGDLGSYIRVSETKVTKGKQTTFSIDPAYIEAESNNAKLTYYWSTSKNPASRKASYTVNTNELDSGKQHLVRIALYKTPVGGTRTSLNGMAYFEVIEGSAGSIETGVINFQIMNQDKNTPETFIKYTLISNSDPSWVHHDETDSQGKVEITNAPLGKYTLKLGNSELDIVLVESN